MQPFYIDIDRDTNLVTLVGVSFKELAPLFPIVPDNILFLKMYTDKAVFDPALCAFFLQGEEAVSRMFGGDAPDSLAFVDYKKNAKQFLSEKEFARFAAAADNFAMPSNPYSATLDNQYLYLSEGNAIKLFLKNTDRFVPMLSRLVLQRFFDPDVLPPPDSTIMYQLQNLCAGGALFTADKTAGCKIWTIGRPVLDQIKFFLQGDAVPASAGHLLNVNRSGKWKLQAK